MDFPSRYPDSPADVRSLAGPSRSRHDARQARTSSLKPYHRPTLAQGLGTASNSRGDEEGLSKIKHDNLPSHLSPLPSDSTHSSISKAPRTSFSSIRTSSSAGASKDASSNEGKGLFSGLRQAIFSKPLTWLQGGGPRSDRPVQKRAEGSLPSAEQREAADRLRGGNTKEVGTKNIESRVTGLSDSAGAPMTNVMAPLPSPSRFGTGNLARDSTRATRSPSPAFSSASAHIQSLGRKSLSTAPTSQTLFGSPSTPGYRRSGSMRPGEGSVTSGVGAAASASGVSHSPSFAFGFGSERRMGGLNSSASAYGGLSSSVSGAPRTLHTSSPLASPSSQLRLPSKSPLARRSLQPTPNRTAGYAASEMGASPSVGPRTGLYMASSASRPGSTYSGSLFGGSRGGGMIRAGSVGGRTAMSMTPKRREWSSLNLAPPSRAGPSEGEELMREYSALKKLQQQDELPPAPEAGNDQSMRYAQGIGRSYAMESGSRPLKREASMSVDLDDDDRMSSVSSRKRQKQMVWDTDLGFVSREELRAMQPARPKPQNEAERILNALEGMRTPLGDARREGAARSTTPSRHMAHVPVPLPVPERSEADGSRLKRSMSRLDPSKTLSPHSRALKQSKLPQSDSSQDQVSMRSKLRRSALPASTMKAVETSPERKDQGKTQKGKEKGSPKREEDAMSEASDGRRESDGTGDRGSDEDIQESEEDEDEIMEPPRRRTGRTTTQVHTFVPQRTRAAEQTRTLRSGKVVDSSPPKTDKADAKPMSRARPHFSVNGVAAGGNKRGEAPFGTQKPAIPVDTRGAFTVRVDSSESGTARARSSLRQGAEKRSRTHGKSGKISAWDVDEDEDEDDEMPGSEDLNKIKLPSTMFPSGFSFGASSSLAPAAPTAPATLSMEEAKSKDSSGPAKALPAPSDDPEKKKEGEKEPSSTSKNPLLSRLGGLAPPEADSWSTTPKKSPPSKPSLAFTAPSSTDPSSKPLFSLPTSSAPAPSLSSSSATSDFFKSSTVPSTTPASEPKKVDEPIPNFFASSLAKSSAASPAQEMTKGESNATSKSPFSFGSTSATSQPASSPASGGLFSFGQPSQVVEKGKEGAESRSDTSMFSPFTFGKPSGANEPATSTTMTSQSAETSFGSVVEPSSSSATKPSLGTPASINTSVTNGKRGAEEDEQEQPAKKSILTDGGGIDPSPGGFRFEKASEASKEKAPAVAAAAAAPFSFGKPTGSSSSSALPSFNFGGTSKPETEKSDSHIFSFGKKDEATKSSTDSTKGISFGQPSGNNNASGFASTSDQAGGNNKSTEMMDSFPSNQGSSSSFNFGGVKPSAPSSNGAGFAFGMQPASSTNSNVTNAFGGSSAPAASSSSAMAPGSGFRFGTSGPSDTSSAKVNPFGASTASPSGFGAAMTGGSGSGSGSGNGSGGDSPTPFSFGQPQQQSQPNSRGQSPAPFQFGAPAHTSSQPPTPSFGTGAGTPTFGNDASGSRPDTPSGGGFGGGFGNQSTSSNNNPSSGFNFNFSSGGGGGGAAPSAPSNAPSSSPFVFGAGPSQSSASAVPPQPFAFGASSSTGGIANGGFASGTTPQNPPAVGAGGGNLFNIGAAPSTQPGTPGSAGGSGRQVRSLPKRGPRRG